MPDAGRVIAGTARSIRLDAPGAGTRPLADRVKQTLFAILDTPMPITDSEPIGALCVDGEHIVTWDEEDLPEPKTKK